MKKRWRNACIGLIGLLITFQTQAQASYPLKKIGKWENESDLAYYYASYASPLLIINTTVYLPHDKCVEVRRYGGSYATKDLEGNIIIKSEGADSAEKKEHRMKRVMEWILMQKLDLGTRHVNHEVQKWSRKINPA